MSDLDPTPQPPAPQPAAEDRTLEELARRRIAHEDDQLRRNLEELERLASGDEGP